MTSFPVLGNILAPQDRFVGLWKNTIAKKLLVKRPRLMCCASCNAHCTTGMGFGYPFLRGDMFSIAQVGARFVLDVIGIAQWGDHVV